MSDEPKQPDTPTTPAATPDPPPAPQKPSATPPAEAKNTDSELMISKSRFDEVNNELKQLRADQEKAAKAQAEAEKKRLEEQNEFKKLYEEEQKAKAEAEAAKAALELSILKRDVAQEKKLPAVLADRLLGATKEELEADADKLLKSLPKGDGVPNLDGGAGYRTRGPNAPSEAEIREQAARLGVNADLLAQQYGVTLSKT